MEWRSHKIFKEIDIHISNTKNINFSVAFNKINKHGKYENMTHEKKKNQSIEVELDLTQIIEFQIEMIKKQL